MSISAAGPKSIRNVRPATPVVGHRRVITDGGGPDPPFGLLHRPMATRKKPIDPADSPRLVLEGRVVTMGDSFQVFARGRVYTTTAISSRCRTPKHPHRPASAAPP